MATINILVNGQPVAFDPATGTAKLLPKPAVDTIKIDGRDFTVGKTYSSTERAGVTLPPGYRWSSMRFGIDSAGGINLKLERSEDAPPILPKGEKELLVKPTNPHWVSDTASFWHDGKTLTVSRQDHDDIPSQFGISVAVNGVSRTLCPQTSGPTHVPYGPAEGTRIYMSSAQTPVRPGDRVTITDPQRNVTTTVTIG